MMERMGCWSETWMLTMEIMRIADSPSVKTSPEVSPRPTILQILPHPSNPSSSTPIPHALN